jgi:enoyl-CoA hydratase/carnithine racemase
MANLVKVRRNETTTEIMLDRPGRRNALDLPVLEELLERLAEATRDPQTHVIVLHGAGEGFCAGADLGMLGALSESDDAASAFAPAVQIFQQIVHMLATAPKVTLAALHGFALGAGLDLALACDLRLAASGTQLASSYVKFGLVPDGGSTWALPRLIGLGPALAMLLSGDPIDTEGAYRLGLLHRRVPQGLHLEEGRNWARALAERSLPAQVAIKRLARVDPRLTLSAALKEEWEAQRRLFDDREPFHFLPRA